MPINIEHLAMLARIRLEEGDKSKIEKKITDILEHFNQLEKLNTQNVNPFFHASPEMTLRDDIPEAPLPIDDIIKNAPDSYESCFRIPKVVGEIEQ